MAQEQVEVQQLKQQLADSEKKQQETKATVIALRSEFMQLVDMMSDATGGHHDPNTFEFPVAVKDYDYALKSPHHSGSAHADFDKYGDLPSPKAHRQVPQAAAIMGGFRRPTGSPRSAGRAAVAAAGAWAAGNRPAATRPRG